MGKAITPVLRKVGGVFAALFLLGSGQAVLAQQTSKSGTTRTVIVEPLSLVKVTDLDFGQIFVKPNTGTVTLAPDGTRASTGGLIFGPAETSVASFAGLGRRNQFVNISLGSNTIWLTGPGTRMRVRNFVIGSTPTAVLSTVARRFRITSANGAFLFPLGATLEVGRNQTPGVYSGEFDITLQYQ